MPVQPTPPIQLDPSMDKGHELTFINQNFQNIANVIQQNSFVIAKSGTVTLTKGANILSANTSVTHNLGITPMCIAAIDYGGGAFYSLPAVFIDDATGAVVELVNTITDPTYATFVVKSPSGGTIYPLAQAFTIKYYLLQQTAN